jgi:hypothetical protein
MAAESEPKRTPPYRPHRSSVADERKVRSISDRIFAELFSRRLQGKTVRASSFPPRSSSRSVGGQQSDQTFSPVNANPAVVRTTRRRGRKGPLSMKVYRTESHYYFSSKQLLPAGALVFFSDRLRRYVHPTAGTLLDPYPRLCLLPEDESAAFEERWQETLSHF